ncbi:hypothetical protein JOC54_000325 [Alkalihalobacillus xiaoxiensis]|uniref:DUF3923 family protein n=1 Tax=Shouchella xiaoxiensis TaxID=766895 RepID=A0ABS2SNJ9_9BACI|nr:hypothetical protein [Shouchella xiaoxiensis]MBM7837094.1 hypothetical protein [Shouchella xiaoxiensis]
MKMFRGFIFVFLIIHLIIRFTSVGDQVTTIDLARVSFLLLVVLVIIQIALELIMKFRVNKKPQA